MKRWLAAAVLLAGCGPAVAPPGWDDGIGAVRAGRSDAVRVTAGRVTPDRLADLRDLPGLRNLHLLRGTPGPPVCDGGNFTAALLPLLPGLRRLACDGPANVAALAGNGGNLTHLNLPAADADGADLSALAVGCPRLELLRLGAAGVRGRDLASLRDLSDLRFLHLIDAPLTDAAVPHLAAGGRLESLYLDGSALTAAGWAELGRLRPGLHVHADDRHPGR